MYQPFAETKGRSVIGKRQGTAWSSLNSWIRPPLLRRDPPEQGEDRLLAVIFLELSPPRFRRALQLPAGERHLPEVRVRSDPGHPPLSHRTFPFARLAQRTGVVAPEVALQGDEHRVTLRPAHLFGDDRGEPDGRLRHAGRRNLRKGLQVRDEDRHVPLAEGVPGHHAEELPAFRVRSFQDGVGERLVGVRGAAGELPEPGEVIPGPCPQLRRPFHAPLPQFRGLKGAVPRLVENVPVGGRRQNPSLERPETAAQMTTHAGEHGPLHGNVPLDHGRERLARRQDPVPVDPLAQPQRFLFGKFGDGRVVPGRRGEDGRQKRCKAEDPRQGSEENTRTRRCAARRHFLPAFPISLMRSDEPGRPSILTHSPGPCARMKVTCLWSILSGT